MSSGDKLLVQGLEYVISKQQKVAKIDKWCKCPATPSGCSTNAAELNQT